MKDIRFVCTNCKLTSMDAAWLEAKQCQHCGGDAIPVVKWVWNKMKETKHGSGDATGDAKW